MVVCAGHLSHLSLKLLALAVSRLMQPLLLDIHFDFLSLLVLDFEDVLMVIFAVGSSRETLILGGVGFGYLGESKRFAAFGFGVVDGVDQLFRVHV